MLKNIIEDNNYMIDEFGNVFSKRKNKFLTPKHSYDGYLRVQLWNQGKCRFIGIHRLVAQTFIPNPDNKPFVNHINGIKTDNRVENLEWCTQKENIKHAFDKGLSKKCPKNWIINSKPVDQLTLDGVYIKSFPSQMEVERTLDIKHSNISYAIKHNTSAGGYKWVNSETSND